MKNANLPAAPIGQQLNMNMVDPDCNGLTKREHFAAILPYMDFSVSNETLEEVIGRKVNFDDVMDAMKAAAEIESKFRVIRADALLAELEK